MAVLENKTGFAAELFTAQDPLAHLYVVLAVRGTFDISADGVLRRSDAQEPLCASDVFFGEPGQSSVKYASDFSATKPGTDIAMVGSAHAPGGKPITRMVVALRVGPIEKNLIVFGDREWSRALTGFASITPPKPFVTMPLVYERAFGGSDTSHDNPSKHDWERRNPIGSGFRVHKSLGGLPLPNLEDPEALISSASDRPFPQSFGFIDRSWEPRLRFAGTYDETWRKEQCPLLPSDFDDRFFQAAHPDLVCRPHLRGDEPVRIVGAVPEGTLGFQLPEIAIGASVEFRTGEPRPGVALLDTVILRPDERKLTLVWRLTIGCSRKVFDVEVVTAFAVRLKTALELVPELRDRVAEPHARPGW